MTLSPVPVLFVESYPQALAGQQETLTALLRHAPQAGIAASVVTPDEGVFVDRLRNEGHEVDVIPQPESIGAYGGAVYRYGFLRKLGMALQVADYVRRLRHFIRSKNVSVVFCNDMRGLLTYGLAARLSGVPVVIWDKLDKPHGFYDALQLPITSLNLMIAEVVAQKYPRWQRKLWNSRVKVIRNGIDLGCFQPSERHAACARIGLPDDKIVLAIVGTVTQRKGHDLLMPAFGEALAQVPQLRLLVIGEADSASIALADTLREAAPPEVLWLGYRDDIDKLLPAVDIMVSPSLYEGMGRVNIEAMATEIPVIGSAHTGIAEVIVDGETGLLVDIGEPGRLAAAILRLAGDDDLRQRMGKAARQRAEDEFDMKKQVRAVLREITMLGGS